MKNMKLISLLALLLLISAAASLPVQACGLNADKGADSSESSTAE